MTDDEIQAALREAAVYGCEWMRAAVVASLEQAARNPVTPEIGREILRHAADIVRAIESIEPPRAS